MSGHLTSLFRPTTEDAQDGDKLHELYWNRAGLKKEFAALRDEKYRLQDRLKQQQGATERVQQKMNHLESLLLDREWVHNVAAFYQLRRLGMHCNAKLERFAEQLKQKREGRVYERTLAEWNARRDADCAELERALADLRLQHQRLEDDLHAAQAELAQAGGLRRMLRGTTLTETVEEIRGRLDKGLAAEQNLLGKVAELQNQAPPDHEGLGIDAKRSINFLIMSLAQQLYLRLDDDGLTQFVKDANEKSVGAINYGSKAECDRLVKCVGKCWNAMETGSDEPGVLRRRAKLIADRAEFRSDEDTVPAPHSVDTLFLIGANGHVREKELRLLGDNYFAIARVFSR